jgi:PAS domain S-box-containing protein
LLTIFLVVLVWSLHARLRNPLTRWWGWAWSASAVFLAVGVVALWIPRDQILLKSSVTLAAVLFGYLHLPLLVFGAVSWRWPAVITGRRALAGISAALAAGALSFAVSRFAPDPITGFAIRHAPRNAGLAICLFVCAWVFFKGARESRSRAAAITGASCLAYAFDQTAYAVTEAMRITGGPQTLLGGTIDVSLLSTARLLAVDLVLICGISVGMILLLVEGHQQAERALLESDRRGRDVAEENAALQAEIRRREDAEQAWRRSEDKLAAAYRSSPCCMAMTTFPEGRFLEINDGFERMTGFSREEVIGRTSLEIGLWADPATRDDWVRTVNAEGRLDGYECVLRGKRGEHISVVYSAEVLTIGGQKCLLGASLDVTALKQIEARHNAILKAIPDWIFLLSRDGVFLECQVRDARDLLMPPAEFIGRHVRDVLPPELAARLIDGFAAALRADQPVSIEYSIPIRDEMRFYEVRAVATDNEQILSLVRDITTQKRAERHARELQDELAHAGRVMALGTLTGSLAHEINQPLTAIMTNAHAAEHLLSSGQAETGEVRAALHDIMSDNRRIGEVLRRLRLLLKKDRREFSTVDINAMVNEVVALVHSHLLGRQIALDVTLGSNLPSVLGDRVQLQQVVLNLLMNATGAVLPTDPESRRLSLTTALDDGQVVVSVTDRGVGASDEQLARMFEPFFTTKSDGMGLGLAISRTIVDAHAGTIGARRNPDRGLTCSFRLPVVALADQPESDVTRLLEMQT